MTALILALDASSTMIGWVLYDGLVHDHGEIRLGVPAPKSAAVDISERCRQAHAHLNGLLELYPEIDCIALESPVARYGSAVIAQARVSGALMAAASLKHLLVVEVTPTAAKKALTGKGNADKALMQRAAQAYEITGEHASDALGVALAAAGRVQVVPA